MSDTTTLDELPQPEYEGRVDPEALETDGDNPNEMTDEQFGLLVERMRQNGWLGGPVITDTDGLIADGEHRWRAAKENGLDEVPVRQYDIDDATRRLWRQELNKIHGEHDDKRDALEYDYLLDAGKSDEVHDLVEAADEDLDELLAQIKMDTSRPAAYDYDPEHNVYFEGCVEGMAERVPDDSVDAVITDPPYGMDYQSDHRNELGSFDKLAGDGDHEEALQLLRETLTELSRVVKPSGHVYVFTRWDIYPDFYRAVAEHFDVKNLLVWVKNNWGMGDPKATYRPQHELCIFATGSEPRWREEHDTDVMEYDRVTGDELEHPTEKPVPLLSRLMENSTQEGYTVLDPFMGSGTTAVAAIQNDRDYIGFEIDEENYRDVIERRIGEAKRQKEATVNND